MPRIPPLLLVLAFAALIAALGLRAPLGHFAFPAQSVLAAFLALAGLAVAAAAVREFARARTTVDPVHIEQASSLVTSGPFAFSRNPMYLGFLLLLAALALWLGATAGLLPLPLFAAWVTRFQIMPEERVLEEKFGAAFRAYAARTRRWL